MKTSKWLTVGLYLFLAARSLTAAAADPRVTGGYSQAPVRGLFGLPVPQQWTSNRGGYSAPGYGQYNTTRFNTACPDGNCQTGFGQRPAYGNTSFNCANGQCAPGNCVNGNCAAGYCPDGRCSTGQCRDGSCGVGGHQGSRYLQDVQNSWSPRGSRTGPADVSRRSTDFNEQNTWTQRTRRPVLAPVDDAFGSRYRRDDLNLRENYFGGEERGTFDSRFPSEPGTRLNSNEWNRPARRSLEAPAESTSGVARF